VKAQNALPAFDTSLALCSASASTVIRPTNANAEHYRWPIRCQTADRHYSALADAVDPVLVQRIQFPMEFGNRRLTGGQVIIHSQ
jgi:hypothetical protein